MASEAAPSAVQSGDLDPKWQTAGLGGEAQAPLSSLPQSSLESGGSRDCFNDPPAFQEALRPGWHPCSETAPALDREKGRAFGKHLRKLPAARVMGDPGEEAHAEQEPGWHWGLSGPLLSSVQRRQVAAQSCQTPRPRPRGLHPEGPTGHPAARAQRGSAGPWA